MKYIHLPISEDLPEIECFSMKMYCIISYSTRNINRLLYRINYINNLVTPYNDSFLVSQS